MCACACACPRAHKYVSRCALRRREALNPKPLMHLSDGAQCRCRQLGVTVPDPVGCQESTGYEEPAAREGKRKAWARMDAPPPGTCRQYSKKAKSHEKKIAFHIGHSLYFKWRYHAAVITQHEHVSRHTQPTAAHVGGPDAPMAA